MFTPPLDSPGNAVIRFTQTGDTRTLSGGIDERNGHEILLRGLPVTGFMVYNIVNASASPGVLANYSGAFPHRRTVTPESVF
ncbi:MAG: hypothetical protein ABW186_10445 [Rhodanobacteraceae bacterium]